jgi:hypothetical protein
LLVSVVEDNECDIADREKERDNGDMGKSRRVSSKGVEKRGLALLKVGRKRTCADMGHPDNEGKMPPKGKLSRELIEKEGLRKSMAETREAQGAKRIGDTTRHDTTNRQSNTSGETRLD